MQSVQNSNWKKLISWVQNIARARLVFRSDIRVRRCGDTRAAMVLGLFRLVICNPLRACVREREPLILNHSIRHSLELSYKPIKTFPFFQCRTSHFHLHFSTSTWSLWVTISHSPLSHFEHINTRF